jgi:hypothetical protein
MITAINGKHASDTGMSATDITMRAIVQDSYGPAEVFQLAWIDRRDRGSRGIGAGVRGWFESGDLARYHGSAVSDADHGIRAPVMLEGTFGVAHRWRRGPDSP